MSLLTVQNVAAFYGPSQALFDVSLDVGEGEVIALMGRNGMGKSTTVKVICRMLGHSAGQVSFADQDIGALPSHKAARLGIGLVPEGRRCFANLSEHVFYNWARESVLCVSVYVHFDNTILESFSNLFFRRT